MTKQKLTIIPSKSPNIFKIGKKLFVLKKQKIGKDRHIKKLIFEETNEKMYEDNLSYLADKILKNNKIDQKTILQQALLHLSKEELNNVKKGIDKMKKSSYKKGCLSIDIDGTEIPIFAKVSFLEG